MSGEARKQFKDWFDDAAAQTLAEQVKRVHPPFNARRFMAAATQGLGSLEMMARVRQFAAALRAELHEDIDKALLTLQRSLPPILPDCEAVTNGYGQWPVGEFVAMHGVQEGADTDVAFEMMTELTQRFSSEFAVRPFIRERPDEAFARLRGLTTHASPHVRRWCSEGTRPRLPWGERLRALVDDPAPILPILEALKNDPEEYVRRSVANNLNDIAKDHPDLVVDVAARWLAEEPESKNRARLVKHALRSLVKAAHPGALAVLGFVAAPIEATLTLGAVSLEIGESLEFAATLRAPEDTRFVLELVIEFRKANGTLSPKVFKWTTGTLSAGVTADYTKAFAFVPRSIRRLYVGEHAALLQVNGKPAARQTFELRSPV